MSKTALNIFAFFPSFSNIETKSDKALGTTHIRQALKTLDTELSSLKFIVSSFDDKMQSDLRLNTIFTSN